jgi:SAM-dependent methyltransferase
MEHRELILEQFTLQAGPFARLPAHADGLELLRKLASIKPGQRVLDAACGPGLLACALAADGAELTGLDLTPAMLREAERRSTAQGQKISWIEGDITCLPFADESFDLVCSRYSLHHLLSPAQALAEMIRVCRPGGRVLIADVVVSEEASADYDRIERWRDPSHVHALSRREFASLWSKSGLRILALENHGVRVELSAQLAVSFPVAGGAELIKNRLLLDMEDQHLGLQVEALPDEDLAFTYPISVVLAEKP